MFTFSRNSRRALLAGFVSVVLVAPLLACSGMGGADPKTDVIGTWKFYPSPEELRFFKIVAQAAKGHSKEVIEKKIGGTMTPDEERMYQLIRKDPKSPDVRAVVGIAEQIKSAKVDISGTQMKMNVNGEVVYDKSYTVTSENGAVLNVTLGGDETHQWTVASHDEIQVEILTPTAYSSKLKRQ